MSLWTGINRHKFERHLATLCSSPRTKVQDFRTLPAIILEDAHRTDLDSVLEYGVEVHLADGLAFLAATTDEPQHVTAAALQQSSLGCKFVVAANQGLPDSTAAALQDLWTQLRRLSERLSNASNAEESCRKSAATTEQSCRRIVLRLHYHRILTRLSGGNSRSNASSRVDIARRLQGLLNEMPRSSAGLAARTALARLITELRNVRNASASRQELQTALQVILQAALELMHGDDSLANTYPQLYNPLVQRHEYRVLRALANYWRFCAYLVHRVQKHREWFRNAELIVLRPLPPCRSGYQLRYIHAEVQILIHFESQENRPRYVASSKKPCFLCYCFIRAHATYSVSQSHGEVYEQWTIPDCQHLPSRARRALGDALRQTVGDVQRAVLAAGHSPVVRHIYMQPSQTVTKGLLDELSSGVPSIRSDTLSMSEAVAAISAESDINDSPRDAQVPVSAAGTDGSTSTLTVCETRSSQSQELQLCSRHDYVKIDGLEMFLETTDQGESLSDCAASMFVRRLSLGDYDVAVDLDIADLELGVEWDLHLQNVGDEDSFLSILVEHDARRYELQVRELSNRR